MAAAYGGERPSSSADVSRWRVAVAGSGGKEIFLSPRAARRRWRSSSVDGPPALPHTRGRATLALVEKSRGVGIALAVAALTQLLFVQAAHADTFLAQAAWPPRLNEPMQPVAGPRVRLQVDNPNARLQQFTPLMWRDVCIAPCGITVNPSATYRIGGGTSMASDPVHAAARGRRRVYRGPGRFEGEALGRPRPDDRQRRRQATAACSGGSSSAARTTPTTAASTTSATPCRTSACSSSARAR